MITGKLSLLFVKIVCPFRILTRGQRRIEPEPDNGQPTDPRPNESEKQVHQVPPAIDKATADQLRKLMDGRRI